VTRQLKTLKNLLMLVLLLAAAQVIVGCQTPAPRLGHERAVLLNDQAAAELPEHPEKALKLLSEAQAAFPGLPAVRNNIGVCHMLEGRYWQAAIAFRQASAAAPNDPQPLYNLGRTFELAGNWPQAASYYERALRLAPEDLEITESLVRVYVKLDRPPSDIAPLARKALDMELRPEWIAWLSRYAQTDAEESRTGEPSPEAAPAEVAPGEK